tara:strand:- start:6951 stop:7565 length:615 start_codon:yes stop_codon:yes gene_type:complete
MAQQCSKKVRIRVSENTTQEWDPEPQIYRAYLITHLESKKTALEKNLEEALDSFDRHAHEKYQRRLVKVNHQLLHLDTELRALDAQNERIESQFVMIFPSRPTLSVSEDAPSSILRPPNSFIEPRRPPRWDPSNFTPDAWKRIQQSPSWQREVAARKAAAKSAAESERRVATISAEESIHVAALSGVVDMQLKERARGSFLPDI